MRILSNASTQTLRAHWSIADSLQEMFSWHVSSLSMVSHTTAGKQPPHTTRQRGAWHRMLTLHRLNYQKAVRMKLM